MCWQARFAGHLRQFCLFTATIVLCQKLHYTTRNHTGVGQTPPNAIKQDQACRLQIIRRPHHNSLSEQPRWCGRAERMWQIERHRCCPMGYGRKFGQSLAWRFNHRRNFQWFEAHGSPWVQPLLSCFSTIRKRRSKGNTPNMPRYPFVARFPVTGFRIIT